MLLENIFQFFNLQVSILEEEEDESGRSSQHDDNRKENDFQSRL